MDFKGVDGCEGYVGFGGSGDVECPSAVANCLGPLLLLPLLQHADVIVATCNLQPAAAFSSLSGELEHRLCKFSCFP